MTNKKLPALVRALTHNFDAWIVGSACFEEEPRDYDLFIPIKNWEAVCSMLSKIKCYTLNSMGGLKFHDDEGNEIDIWTGSMENFLASSMFKGAWHIKSGTMIVKVFRPTIPTEIKN